MTATLGAIPGPKAPPLMQIIDWGTGHDSYWNKLADQYGPVFRVRWPFFFEQRVVCFTSIEAAKEILRLPPTVAHGGEANRVLEPSSGTSAVIVVDEAEHKRLRKIIMPPLHGDRMMRWEGFIREQTLAEVATWNIGDAFAMRPVIEKIALSRVKYRIATSCWPIRDSTWARRSPASTGLVAHDHTRGEGVVGRLTPSGCLIVAASTRFTRRVEPPYSP